MTILKILLQFAFALANFAGRILVGLVEKSGFFITVVTEMVTQ